MWALGIEWGWNFQQVSYEEEGKLDLGWAFIVSANRGTTMEAHRGPLNESR